MNSRNIKIVKKGGIGIAILLYFFVILPSLIYIPIVQDLIKYIAVNQVSSALGWEVSIEKFRLYFPLKLEVKDALVIDENRDTLIAATNLETDIAVLPLISSRIELKYAALENAYYRMLSEDSVMDLRAKQLTCDLGRTIVDLDKNIITLTKGNIESGYINLSFDNEKKPKDEPTEEFWKININELIFSNLHYSMQMLPYISDLDVDINKGVMRNAKINTEQCTVEAEYLGADGFNTAYFTPTAEYIAENEIIEEIDTVIPEAKEWTVKGKKISLKNANAIYAMAGVEPMPGIDFNYIEGKNLDIDIENLYNKGTAVRIPITKFKGDERCGISILDGKGTFAMDSMSMALEDFEIQTNDSKIVFSGNIGNGIFDFDMSAGIGLFTNSGISFSDLYKLYPDLQQFELPDESKKLLIQTDIDGNLSDLNIKEFIFDIPDFADLSIAGTLKDILIGDPKVKLSLNGNFYKLNYLKPLLSEDIQQMINLPEFKIDGDIVFAESALMTDLTMLTESGAMALNGNINIGQESYDIDFESNKFPLDKFFPTMGLGPLTLSVKADGNGFDVFTESSSLNCDLILSDLVYDNKPIRNVNGTANISNGVLDMTIDIDNNNLSLSGNIKSTLLNDNYDYSVTADLRHIDLYKLGFSEAPLNGKGQLISSGVVDIANNKYDCVALLDNSLINYDKYKIKIPSASSSFYSDCDSTYIGFNEGDFNGCVSVSCSLEELLSRVERISEILSVHMENKTVNFDEINNELPELEVLMRMNDNNFINSYLLQTDMGVSSLNATIRRDSSLNLNAGILGFKFNETTFDTITVNAGQAGDKLKYLIHIGNEKGNMDKFAGVNVAGFIGSNKLQALYTQKDIMGDTISNLGFKGELVKNTLTVNFFPENPILGARTWSLPENNYMKFIPEQGYFDSDVKLSNENGFVSLKTFHSPDTLQKTIKFDVRGMKLGEWINVAPNAPKIKGELNVGATFSLNDKVYEGNGFLEINDFTYNKGKLGNLKFDLDLDYNPLTNKNEAIASMSVDGRKTMMVRGVVNDTLTKRPIDLNLKLDHFPTSLANPFLPNNMAVMGGYLNGNMQIYKTDYESDIFVDGYMACDSTSLNMPVFGSNLNFSVNPIKVEKNKIIFKDFGVSGANKKPLLLNGYVDIGNFISPEIDLDIKGKNVQLIDSKHTSKSQIFGQGFVNFAAKAKGKLSQMKVDSELTILPETNATYVFQSDVSAISQQQQIDGLVKFVNFNDTVTKDSVPVESLFGLDLKLVLNVIQGSVLSVNLSPEGKNKVEIQGSGNLTYNMNTLGDSRLSGRFTLHDGFVRYYPPFISEKYFTFVPGSYVSWTGDMMNPLLNLKATSKQTSTVVSEGANPTRVNFLITASVTNKLNNMNVTFDLASNNSIIDSELKSMTPLQRSAQAINLMLYNSYTGSAASTASAPNTNMLYSVLSSRLNNLASSMVKGVDISFGINEYNMNEGSGGNTGMNYSYQISKSLFNNRFKMTVGGNYDTGNTNGGGDVAQNLFNNVSFEYNIKPSGNMSIKIYNKLTDNNIYQTQVNETGIAFVMRRRLMTLKDLFKFNFVNKFKKENKTQETENVEVPNEDK